MRAERGKRRSCIMSVSTAAAEQYRLEVCTGGTEFRKVLFSDVAQLGLSSLLYELFTHS